MRAEVVLLSGRLVVEGRLVAEDEERCVVEAGRLLVVGRLLVEAVGRLVVVVVGLTLLLLPAVLAPLGELVLGER